jgi:surfactin synthase thioesterase subunit
MSPRQSPWFARSARHPSARVSLFCLPFSGGGASIYRGWPRLFPPEVEIVPIHLPGREELIEERAELSPVVIARALAERIDLPFAVYGHSLGARLGFEVLRALRSLGVAAPLRFYPAASPPPDVADTFARCVELPDEPFVDSLIQAGAPAELRDEPDLRELLLPLLRHDLRWCHRYRYQPGPPLGTAIVALAGQADVVVTAETMAGWSRHAELVQVLTLPGGHFFLKTAERQLTQFIAVDLLNAVTEPAARRSGGAA